MSQDVLAAQHNSNVHSKSMVSDSSSQQGLDAHSRLLRATGIMVRDRIYTGSQGVAVKAQHSSVQGLQLQDEHPGHHLILPRQLGLLYI